MKDYPFVAFPNAVMRHIAMDCFLIAAICLAAVTTTQAEDVPFDYRIDITYGESGPNELLPPRCCTVAHPESSEPKWVAGLVERLRSSEDADDQQAQHLLFKPALGRQYLAVAWWKTYPWRLDIHEIITGKKSLRTHRVLALDPERPSIAAPSGVWVDSDGAPMLVVRSGSGTSYHGHFIQIFRLSKTIQDVTPKNLGRPIRVEDLNGDGKYQVIAAEGRWGNFFFPCGGCGPLVPIVLKYDRGSYTPACREFSAYYQYRIGLWKKYRQEAAERQDAVKELEWQTDIALEMAQIGDVENGRRVLLDGLKHAAKFLESVVTPEKSDRVLKKIIPAARELYLPIFDKALPHKDAPCPLLLVEHEDTHPERGDRGTDFWFGAE